jgi:hypothetical protein
MTSQPVFHRRTSLVAALLLAGATVAAEPVRVRFTEGLVHGFLKLSSLDGTALADGDLIQTAQGNRVTTRLVFHFKDGSLHDETSVFTQSGQFSLISDRLIQRGPSFPRPLEMTVDNSGNATVRYTDEHGQPKNEREHIDIPADLANGIVLTLLKNVRHDALPSQFSMIVATPKPRLVTLKLQPSADESFSTGGARRKAAHYVLKIDIGGVKGLLAPLAGKQPPDSHVWILTDGAPAFVKSEQQLFMDGPLWRIELVSPVWPRSFN